VRLDVCERLLGGNRQALGSLGRKNRLYVVVTGLLLAQNRWPSSVGIVFVASVNQASIVLMGATLRFTEGCCAVGGVDGTPISELPGDIAVLSTHIDYFSEYLILPAVALAPLIGHAPGL